MYMYDHFTITWASIHLPLALTAILFFMLCLVLYLFKDCCGVNSYTDWSNATLVETETPPGQNYPDSCYPDGDKTQNIYEVR